MISEHYLLFFFTVTYKLKLTRHSSWPDLPVSHTSTLRVFCRSALWDICMPNTSLNSTASRGGELRVRKRQRVASTQGSTATRTYLQEERAKVTR